LTRIIAIFYAEVNPLKERLAIISLTTPCGACRVRTRSPGNAGSKRRAGMVKRSTRATGGKAGGGCSRQAERRSLFRRVVAVRALTREGEDPRPGGLFGLPGRERTLP